MADQIVSKFKNKSKRREESQQLDNEKILNILNRDEGSCDENESDDSNWGDIETITAEELLNENASKPPKKDIGIDSLYSNFRNNEEFNEVCSSLSKENGDIDKNDFEFNRNNECSIPNKSDGYGDKVLENLKQNASLKRNSYADRIVEKDIKLRESLSTIVKSDEKKSLVVPASENKSTKISKTSPYFILSPTKIRIINPLIPSNIWEERIQNRIVLCPFKFIRKLKEMSLMNVPDSKLTSDWILVGVIGFRSPIRESKQGNKYSIWKLTDMEKVGPGFSDGEVNIFLFNNVHEAYWKIENGSVVAILNPKLMAESNDSMRKSKLSFKQSYSVRPNSVQHILHLGKSPDYSFCAFKSSEIPECNKIVNKSICSYCTAHVKKAYFGATTSRATFTVNEKSIFSNKKSHDESWKDILKSRKDQVLCQSLGIKLKEETTGKSTQSFLPQALKGNSIGAINLKRTLTSENENSKNCKKLRTDSSEANKISTFSNFFASKPSQSSKQRAIEIVKAKNGIENMAKLDRMNQIKLSLKQSLLNKKRSNLESTDISSEDKENFLQKVSQGSKNSALIEVFEQREENEQLEKLEKKDNLEEALLSLQEKECTVYTCLTCNYRSKYASQDCRKSNHELTKSKGLERYFECRKCAFRTTSLDVHPNHPCRKCGEIAYIKCASIKDKSNIKLESHKLNVRGTEEKFL